MISFKRYIEEGVGATPSSEKQRHGHHSPLDYMMSGVDQLQKIFQDEKRPTPDDTHHANTKIRGYRMDHHGGTHEHLGTVDFASTDTNAESENYHPHLKIHVFRHSHPKGLAWGGLFNKDFGSVDPNTHTHHAAIYLNKDAVPKIRGSGSGEVDRRLMLIATHELSHAIQHHIKNMSWIANKIGSRKRGTARHFTELPRNKKQRRVVKKAKAAGLKPAEWQKTWDYKDHELPTKYWHSGIEKEARIHQWIPDLLQKIQNHHKQNDTDSKVQRIVTNIKNYGSGIKSKKARDYHFNKSYSDLFDNFSNEFSKSHTQRVLPDQADNESLTRHKMTQHAEIEAPLGMKDSRQKLGSDDIKGGASTKFNIAGVDDSAVPKAIKNRRNKGIANQSHNMRLLAREIHDRVLNSIIKKHSDHDVLATRANTTTQAQQRQQKAVEKKARKNKDTERKTASNSTQTEKPVETKINEPINTVTQPPKKQSVLSKIRNIILGK